jgi:hypothetical protein
MDSRGGGAGGGAGGGRGSKQDRAWKDCKDFTETVGQMQLIVRVSCSDEWVPKYNLKTGRTRPDGGISFSIPIYARGQGRIDIVRVSAVFAKLVKDAEDWIHNEAQHREDEIIESRQEKEKRGMKKDETPKGLSALGKMDAAKRPPATPSGEVK